MPLSYLEDILEQPRAIQATLDGLRNTGSLSSFAQKLTCGEFHRIVLTGMGSSYYALHPIALRLLEHGICAQTIETSELVYHAKALIEPRTLLIVASQSGESAEVIRLLDLTSKNVSVLGITNTEESALAQRATSTILTRAGKETSVSCKTYLATLTALGWLGDQLIEGKTAEQFSELLQTPAWVSRYLENWQMHLSHIKEQLTDIRDLFLLGRGISLAAVGTGALIIKEAARFGAQGMSSAAFRHGPFEMVSSKLFALLFVGTKETANLNSRLLKDIQSFGGKAAAVQKGDSKSPFDLPSDDPCVLPILEILPAQMLSLALAQIQSIEPGRFELTNKITTTE